MYLKNLLVHIKHEGISEALRSNKKSHLLVVPYVKYKTFVYAHSAFLDLDCGTI